MGDMLSIADAEICIKNPTQGPSSQSIIPAEGEVCQQAYKVH